MIRERSRNLLVLALAGCAFGLPAVAAAEVRKVPDAASRLLLGADVLHRAGSAVADAGDLNGDGARDWAVSAPNAFGGAGATYVVFEGTGPSVVVPTGSGLPAGQGLTVIGAGGRFAAGTGDVNGDGRDDLLLDTGKATVSAYVVLGRASGQVPAVLDLRDATTSTADVLVVRGPRAIDGGAAGDFNGDGLRDIVLGFPGLAVNGEQRGAAFVVLGRATGTPDLAAPDATTMPIVGEKDSLLGAAVAGVGDFNGDARADVALVAPGVPSISGGPGRGAAFVVFGTPEPAPLTASATAMAAARGTAIRTTDNDAVWQDVSGAGDMTGDGRSDVALASMRSGDTVVVAGRAVSSTIVVGTPSGDRPGGEPPFFAIRAVGALESGLNVMGLRVTGVGDVNGDGRPDLAVAGKGPSAVAVVHGPALAGAVTLGAPSNTWAPPAGAGFTVLGTSVLPKGPPSPVEDDLGASISGFGAGGLLVGAPRANGGESGGAYLLRPGAPGGAKPPAGPVMKLDDRAFPTRGGSGSGGTTLRIARASGRVTLTIYALGATRCRTAFAGLVPKVCLPTLRRIGGTSVGTRRKIAFTGRLGGKALQPGRYLLVAVARDGERRSPFGTTTFTIRG